MPGSLWVVDYDIPAEPKAKRMAFYRALWKLLEEAKIVTVKGRSTMSVWIIDDRSIAERIHTLAKAFGESHFYKAEQID